MRDDRARRSPTSRLSQFSSGAHAEVYDAVRRALRKGAKGIVLDLRGNGGGLVDEAQLVASAFLSEGPIVTTRGRAVKPRTLNATGDPSRRRRRSSCSSTAAPPRRPRSSRARCRTAIARRSSGRRTFGKGVFQEIIELSNGGALDITAGQYFTPKGRNLGGKGVKTGVGLKPPCRRATIPTRRRDEALAVALRVLASRSIGVSRDNPQPGGTMVALLDKRGRFIIAEPFFERGRRVVVDKHRDARPAMLALLTTSGHGRGHAKVLRVIGRPDNASDVLEALMLDRGLRRRFPPGVERAAREARDAVQGGSTPERTPASDLRELATFTIDPATAQGLRRRDLRRGAAGTGRCASGCTSPTSARSCGRARAVDREAYLRGDERLRPREGRADAARGAVQRRVLARARTRTASR